MTLAKNDLARKIFYAGWSSGYKYGNEWGHGEPSVGSPNYKLREEEFHKFSRSL